MQARLEGTGCHTIKLGLSCVRQHLGLSMLHTPGGAPLHPELLVVPALPADVATEINDRFDLLVRLHLGAPLGSSGSAIPLDVTAQNRITGDIYKTHVLPLLHDLLSVLQAAELELSGDELEWASAGLVPYLQLHRLTATLASAPRSPPHGRMPRATGRRRRRGGARVAMAGTAAAR